LVRRPSSHTVVYTLTKRWAAQREAAIVTHIPGTTRDILELSLDIGGLPVLVADTAGLRDATDEVEKIGIERARKAYVLPLNLCVSVWYQVQPRPSNTVRLTGSKLQMLRFSYSRAQTRSRPHQCRRAHGSRFLLNWLHSSPETRLSCSTKRIYSRHPCWHQQRSQARSHSTAGRSASRRMLARMSSWQDLPQLYRRGTAILLFNSTFV
jgi:hypothetical protein